MDDKPAKGHHQSQSGKKAEKKAKKLEGKNGREKPINHKVSYI